MLLSSFVCITSISGEKTIIIRPDTVFFDISIINLQSRSIKHFQAIENWESFNLKTPNK